MTETNLSVSEHLKILFSEANYPQIIKTVNQTKNPPNHYKFMKTRALILLGQYKTAVDFLDNIRYDNFVDNAVILYLKGWTFQRLGEIDKAIGFVEQSYN